jgi:hypothetical protein
MSEENLSTLIEQQASLEEAFHRFRNMLLDDDVLATELRSVSNSLASLSLRLKRRIDHVAKTV